MAGISSRAVQRDANALAATRALAGTPLSPAAWPRADWWTAFNDPQLDALMDEALADSPTLKVAAARTRKALAFADSAKSALYPQVNGDAGHHARALLGARPRVRRRSPAPGTPSTSCR